MIKNQYKFVGNKKPSNSLVENLRIKQKAIDETFFWWDTTIKKAANELNNISNSNNPDKTRAQELIDEIDFLQRKGFVYEKISNTFEKEKKELLYANLLSGALNIDLNY